MNTHYTHPHHILWTVKNRVCVCLANGIQKNPKPSLMKVEVCLSFLILVETPGKALQWLPLLKGNHRRLQDTHVQVTELRDHAGMLCMVALPVFCAACFHSNQTAVFLKEEPSGLGAD